MTLVAWDAPLARREDFEDRDRNFPQQTTPESQHNATQTQVRLGRSQPRMVRRDELANLVEQVTDLICAAAEGGEWRNVSILDIARSG